MHAHLNQWKRSPEEFLAELTDAAYRVALRHGFRGTFIEVELDLWVALRSVLVSDRRFLGLSRAKKLELQPDQKKAPREQAIFEHRWLRTWRWYPPTW